MTKNRQLLYCQWREPPGLPFKITSFCALLSSEKVYNFVRCRLQQILNYFGPLGNSAELVHEDITLIVQKKNTSYPFHSYAWRARTRALMPGAKWRAWSCHSGCMLLPNMNSLAGTQQIIYESNLIFFFFFAIAARQWGDWLSEMTASLDITLRCQMLKAAERISPDYLP